MLNPTIVIMHVMEHQHFNSHHFPISCSCLTHINDKYFTLYYTVVVITLDGDATKVLPLCYIIICFTRYSLVVLNNDIHAHVHHLYCRVERVYFVLYFDTRSMLKIKKRIQVSSANKPRAYSRRLYCCHIASRLIWQMILLSPSHRLLHQSSTRQVHPITPYIGRPLLPTRESVCLKHDGCISCIDRCAET